MLASAVMAARAPRVQGVTGGGCEGRSRGWLPGPPGVASPAFAPRMLCGRNPRCGAHGKHSFFCSNAEASGGGAGERGGGDCGDLGDMDNGAPLVPLRVHSDYSLQAGALPGCAQVGDLVRAAVDAGLPALALTDHGVMHGAVELLQRCRAAGVKPIIGMDMYVTAAPMAAGEGEGGGGGTKKRSRGGGTGGGSAGGTRGGGPVYQLTVLARSTEGYRNLVALSTASHLRPLTSPPGGGGPYPVVAAEDLAEHRGGLVVLSGGFAWEWGVPGEVPRALAEGRVDDARAVAAWYRSVFGERGYYLQLEDHGYRGTDLQGGADDGPLNCALVKLAREVGARCVVAGSVHMVSQGDGVALDALSCIHGGRRMVERRAVCTGMEYLRSSGDLWPHMRRYLAPEDFRDAAAATRDVAAAVEEYGILSEPRIPDFPDLGPGESADSFLRRLAEDGLRMRLLAAAGSGRGGGGGGAGAEEEGARGGGAEAEAEAEYWQRLDQELGVLSRCGFSSYFLLVWDLLRFAREEGIPVGPGRGSAAGSLVAWSLQLTAMDPVRHGLLFERFLNEERRSMPDIDTDLCIEGRDRVLRYVAERYGDERVAQIGTFGRMTSRAVLRDVARVQGRTFTFSDQLSKLVPVVRGKPTPLSTMVGEGTPSPEFRARYEGDEEVRETVDLAMRLEGVHRSVGVHAAGLVIAPEEGGLSGVPLLRNDEGAVVTQYAMEQVEACGLLKMDLLGLRNLTCIARAYELVREHHGVTLPPMERLPEDDPPTFALLASGQLEGVFQLDTSQGMLQVVRGLRPSCLEDIFALLALYRPGPLDAGLIPLYIGRKHGRLPVVYEHPLLEPILRPTYGVLLYQEQIMAVARDLAGYTLGEADLLRRAMGKKKRDEMEAQRAKFTEGAAARGVAPDVAESLFEQMVAFAEYCFNKSHSAAYGLITYTTAHLKANYPVAFMAALLSVNRRAPDKLHRCMAAASRMGIRLLPPCVNSSGPDFSVAGFGPGGGGGDEGGEAAGAGGGRETIGAIRFGLEAVRGVGAGAVGALLAAREEGGPFASLPELVARAGAGDGALNSRALEALAGCGALDALHPTGWDQGGAAATGGRGDRRRMMAEVKPVLKWASARRQQQQGGGAGGGGRQANLFDALGPGSEAAAVYGAEHSDPSRAYAAHRQKDDFPAMMMLLLHPEGGGEGGGEGGAAGDDAPPDPSRPLSDDERLRLEKSLLGFYVSGHPLEGPLARVPRWLGHVSLAELGGASSRAGEVVAAPVLLTGLKAITTRNGEQMARVELEDPTGRIDGVVFPGAYAAAREHLQAEAKLLVWGRLQVDEGGDGGGMATAAAAAATGEGADTDGGGAGDLLLQDAAAAMAAGRTELIVSSVQPLTEESVVLAVGLSPAEAANPATRTRLRGALAHCTAAGRKIVAGGGRPGGVVLPTPVVAVVGGGGGAATSSSPSAAAAAAAAAARVVLLGPAWNVLHVEDAAEKLRGQGFAAEVLPLLLLQQEPEPGGEEKGGAGGLGLGGLLPPSWDPLPRASAALEGAPPPVATSGAELQPGATEPRSRSLVGAGATPTARTGGGGGSNSSGLGAARYGIQQAGPEGGRRLSASSARESHASIASRIRRSKRKKGGPSSRVARGEGGVK